MCYWTVLLNSLGKRGKPPQAFPGSDPALSLECSIFFLPCSVPLARARACSVGDPISDFEGHGLGPKRTRDTRQVRRRRVKKSHFAHLFHDKFSAIPYHNVIARTQRHHQRTNVNEKVKNVQENKLQG